MALEIEKFQLRENELLIGSGLMAFRRGSKQGIVYVTNQRVCFHEWMTNFVYMKLPLSEVAGYQTKRFLFLLFVNIHDKGHKKYSFSGFPAKKLQGWLEQVGIKKLDW